MPSVAATSPPVLIAYLAAHTSQLRLGSGGVMLPNHAPLAVAEQFALLEAAAPGPHRPGHRPGAGLRPGDVVCCCAAPRVATTATSRTFPEYLDDVAALMSARGVRVPLPQRGLHPQGHAGRGQRAAAVAARLVDVLGASGRGQGAAVRVRAPLLRPGHRGGAGASTASEFLPSDLAAEPVTFLTVNAAVAETRDEATALMLPNLQMMARLRTGQPLGPLDLVEDAEQQRAHAAGAGASSTAGCAGRWSAHPPRPPNSCARWPTSSTSTR